MPELDADARAFADAVDTHLTPLPMHQQGVDETRRRMALLPAREGPAVHQVADRTLPGPHGDIPVRVYRPAAEAALPVLVWLHGGAWCLGGLGSADAVCRTLANDAQVVVVNVDYRLAPEHKFPVPFEEAFAAVAWVGRHAAELGGDPGRVAVGGDSAGATLAAAVALHARDHGPALALQVLIYPAPGYPRPEQPSFQAFLGGGPVVWSEDVVWSWDVYLRDEHDRDDPRAAPAAAATLAGGAPAFVLTAEHDPMRDDGRAYAERLRAEGVRVEHRTVDGVPHGFFTVPGVLAKATRANADVAAALRTAFAA